MVAVHGAGDVAAPSSVVAVVGDSAYVRELLVDAPCGMRAVVMPVGGGKMDAIFDVDH